MIFHKLFRHIGWLLLLSGVACAAPVAVEPEPTAVPIQEATPMSYPAPPDSQLNDPAAYPAPPDLPTAAPSRYPAPDTASTVWLVRPQGIQCETPALADMKAAVATLTAQNITVLATEEVEIPQVQACGYPTSLHYRVQISTADKATAEQLGWYEQGTSPTVNPADT